MIKTKLFEMQDPLYRDFQAKLMPTVPKNKIIGVRTPVLREFAKELYKGGEYKDFLKRLPHEYYEEDNLHGFLIEMISDYDECIKELNRFLPYVDNWASCDCTNPKILKKYPEKTFSEIEKWLLSGHTYTVRYGIKKLMDNFLDEDFDEKYLDIAAGVKSDEYYVKMMKAWYFATALAKRYEESVIYLKEKRLTVWEHNKTIQKAVESCRISRDKKEELRKMRILQ
ncbi:MAG: DNA alkylation repair protein [Ruminococcaceae bacterium]|nr:DNA alkylation repair protein [Oscillospiraceae bacterium]